ncbi:hypothetical protein KDL67_15725 [bacterium]|nr:hypothetical protein [bacterium]
MFRHGLLILTVALQVVGGSGAKASVFEPSLGWVEDVDVVVAPGGEFLVSPEQRPDGSAARLQLIDLDAATGGSLGVGTSIAVPGFERGVDPLVVPELGVGLGATVLAPTESPDGLTAGLLVLLAQADGSVSFSRFIALGDLGFAPDVDGTWEFYAGPAVAYFPLESDDAAVRGILAVDADPRPGFGAVGVGACTLLSTDGRLLGDDNLQVDWLPGLVPGVDPDSFEDLFSSRLVLPVAGPGAADLLLVDFDPSLPSPPAFLSYASVTAVNGGSSRPTPFPGFEQGVDLRRFDVGCGAGGPNTLLVPVEGPGDVADVYLLDKDGNSLWVLSIDGQAGGLQPFGFTPGVDMLPLCGAGGAHPNRLLLPLQTADGSDADLWFIDLVNGSRYASAEDLNPGLTVEGFEVGIEPLPWIDDRVLVPVEDPDGSGRLLLFDGNGVLLETEDYGPAWGFTRSVDPAVASYGASRYLAVPISQVVDPEETDVIHYADGTFLGAQSLEALNAGSGLEFGAFLPDLDPAVSENWHAGRNWAILPEAGPGGVAARLRFEFVQQTAVTPTLLVATDATGAVPASLQMLSMVTGFRFVGFDDLHGVLPGLDLADGRGALAADVQPAAELSPGADADADPVTVESTLTGVGDGAPSGDGVRLALHVDGPQRGSATIRLTLGREAPLTVEIVDVAGRRVRRLLHERQPAGEFTVLWDARDDRGHRVGRGVYLVRASLRGEQASAKLVLLR